MKASSICAIVTFIIRWLWRLCQRAWQITKYV